MKYLLLLLLVVSGCSFAMERNFLGEILERHHYHGVVPSNTCSQIDLLECVDSVDRCTRAFSAGFPVTPSEDLQMCIYWLRERLSLRNR